MNYKKYKISEYFESVEIILNIFNIKLRKIIIKIFYCLIITLFIFAQNNDLFCLEAELSRTTYSYWTNYYLCGQPPCQQEGNQCLVIIDGPINIPGSIASAGGGMGGRIITFTFDDETEKHTPNIGLGQPYNYLARKSYKTFREGESLRIEDCPEDETLVGLTIDLEGKTTDANGKLYYYVPY